MPATLTRPGGRSLLLAGQCAGLLALTLLAYGPVWQNGFVDFDDEVYITPNPNVLRGLSWEGFCWAWTNEDAPYHIPLTWLSFQADAQFFSPHGPDGLAVLSPAAVHGQNLFWHAGAVLLLFGLWRRLTGAGWCSFLAAALFAVHPMHVESVAWAIERKDVLSGFFGVLSLWLYVRWVDRPTRLRYLALAAAFVTGLLAKPMLITLPFLLLLLDFWPLRRLGPGPTAWLTLSSFGRLVREKGILIGLALVAAAATLVSRMEHGALVSLDRVSGPARLANALAGYGWYLQTTFWPSGLAALYPHRHDNWSVAAVAAGAGVLLGVTALSLWQARRRPWLLVGWLWFVGGLLPVIGLAQGGVQAWADRFSYWPHVGLFAALAWGFAEACRRCRLPAGVTALVALVVVGGLVGASRAQVRCWHDSVTLWEHAVAVTTDNDHAQEHLSLSYRKQGRLDDARRCTFEAYRIQSRRRGRPVAPPATAALKPYAGVPH